MSENDETKIIGLFSKQPIKPKSAKAPKTEGDTLAETQVETDADTVRMFDKFLDMAERGEIKCGIALAFNADGVPVLAYCIGSPMRENLLKFNGLLSVLGAQLTDYLLEATAPPQEGDE